MFSSPGIPKAKRTPSLSRQETRSSAASTRPHGRPNDLAHPEGSEAIERLRGDRIGRPSGAFATGGRETPLFSARERAALAYAEEATGNRRVSDATFQELRNHFSEEEIAEITWVNAIENHYNLLNVPLEIGSDGFCSIAQARTA